MAFPFSDYVIRATGKASNAKSRKRLTATHHNTARKLAKDLLADGWAKVVIVKVGADGVEMPVALSTKPVLQLA